MRSRDTGMKEDVVYRLTKKQQQIGILAVCLFFVCAAIWCLRKQKETYEYVFMPTGLELKTATIEDGIIHSEEAGEDYAFATKPFILPAGGYTLSISYASTAEGSILAQANNDCVFDIWLPVTGGTLQTITDERLILPGGTDRGRLKFYQTGEGTVDISEISINSYKHIYRDYYVYIIMAFILSAGLIFFIIMFNRFNLTRTGWSYVGLFAIALVAVNIPFMIKGTYYEIDTQAHMKRIEAIAQGLRDGQFPVIIGPNYANQYGELVALQPGLFLYIPAILRLFNVSIPLAYNLYMIMVNIATAIAAFVCAERLFMTIRWAIIAAVFYLVEPFRLFVMLGLGAGAGMGTALIFLPFLIIGMHETMNRGGFRWKYIAVGLWGMACSHVMGFALSAIALLVYILLHLKRLFEKNVFIALVKAAIMFGILSVGVLLPFAGYYFTDWNRTALAWTDFYHFPADWTRESQNYIALTVIAVSYLAIRKTGNLTRFGRGIFAIGFASVIMALSVFPWFLFKNIGFVDTFLSMMQYPRRFHFLAVPYVALVAAEAVCSNMDSRTKKRRQILYAITGVLAVGVMINYYGYFKVDKLFHDPLAGEINTLMEDYLPGGTLTEWYDNDTGEFSDYDTVAAYSYNKINTHIDCTYISRTDGQYMEFPLFYYDGYKAYDQNGKELPVEQGGHNRVRVYLTKSEEPQELHLGFEVKKSYRYCFMFSLITGTLWLMMNIANFIYRVWKSPRVIR